MTPSQIGPYPIEREVGRGGMGVVYLGRDPRLHRPVAIKVLPEAFARDPERLARFEREARLLAALTHPHIAGIYGLEEENGQRFLVLEYVEGETLAEHLRRKPLPIEETLEVCRQVASALEAAHEAGIVHRDLKPGNIKLTPAGDVKVLDFGLAKGAASSDSSLDLSQSPTMTQAATGVGVILGTAAYMSPEQARGKSVDRRTDIWSFGCLLYECLTGEQAFAGETVSDMIALILQGEPAWSRLPERTPARLRELLERCLEKDAKRRLRDIGDARIAIEELQGAPASGTRRATESAAAAAPTVAPFGRPRRRRRALAGGAALVIAGAIAGVAAWNLGGFSPESAKPMRFVIPAPPHAILSGDPNEQAISPDGSMLAFVASDSTGQTTLWVRPLGDFKARQLPGTKGASLPFWSPDGRQLGFFAESKLRRLRLDGGAPSVICDATDGRGAAWNRKGVIVFGPTATGPLFKVSAGGGTPEAATVLDTTRGESAHRWPRFLPDGKHFTYAALPARDGSFANYVASLGSTKRTPLMATTGAVVYAAPGYLVFTRSEALTAQRFDAGRLRTTGEPFAIGDPPAGTNYTAAPGVSVSANGVLAWVSRGKLDTRLVWMDRAGRETGRINIPLDRWSGPVLSPDGRRALVQQELASGGSDVWIADLDREVMSRLTYQQAQNTAGAWSPDGRDVAFASNRRGPRDLYRRAADGSGTDQLVHQSSVPFKDPTDWSPDGKWIPFMENSGANGWDLRLLPAAGGPPIPYLVTPFNEQNGQVSPDGKWLLYESDESGSPQAYVQSFPTPGNKRQVSKTGAFFSVWARGGREILVVRPDGVLASVPVEPGAVLRFGAEVELFRLPTDATGWWPSRDGQRFLTTVPAERAVPGISVAVGWQAGREE